MNERNKIRLGWAAFCFVVFHFTLIFIYAFPSQYVPSKLKTVSAYYVHPLFEQTWGMFVPAPHKHYQVWVDYEFSNGDKTGWIRPAESAIDWHSKLRVTHHGELALAESNLMYWVDLDIDRMDIAPNPDTLIEKHEEFLDSRAYRMVGQYTYGFAHYLFDRKPVHASVKCLIQDVVTKETGIYRLPDYYWFNLPE